MTTQSFLCQDSRMPPSGKNTSRDWLIMTKFTTEYIIWHLELSSILLQPRFLDICSSIYFTIASQNQLTVHQIWTMRWFFFSITLTSSIAPVFILTVNKHLLNGNKVAHMFAGHAKGTRQNHATKEVIFQWQDIPECSDHYHHVNTR